MSAQMRKIEKKLGEAGYARALKLLEVVAQAGGAASNFSPTLDLKSPTTDVDYLSDEWGIKSSEAKRTLRVFADTNFIDAEKWKDKVVYIPAMLEVLDEWTRRKKRKSSSGDGPD
jgi:transcription initiation factor IIE alpha subunit